MIPSIIIIGLLLIVFYRLLRHKRKVGSFSTGIGNALFQFHTFFRPTTHTIVEAKKQRKTESRQGDDGPPELPPWAQSGN